MRLIDADKLKIKHFVQRGDQPIGYEGTQPVYEYTDLIAYDVDNAPTIDAEPVRHGHWEWNDYGGFGNYHCTVCRHIPYGKFSRMHRLNYMYCPYCGAKMDKEKENETN